jgi:SAM-dependent methyltransferase
MFIQEPDIEYYNQERREMLAFIPKDAQSFLELGCGSGAFADLLSSNISLSSYVGVEVHPDAAAIARKKNYMVVESPIEVAMESIESESIDCVICNDVLEHLEDPWEVLRMLSRVLRPQGYIVASIPNVRYFPVFKSYFSAGDWKYDQSGVLDRTHLRFFTKLSIGRMFDECEYDLIRIEGIFREPLPWKASVLNWVLRGKMRDMEFERFACVAKLRSVAGNG